MTEKKRTIELLSPAKNLSCAKAAIISGADAVYMGAELFSARKNAGNSIKDIYETVQFAHKFNVRVYVTVNTILYNHELKKACDLIYELNEIGVDAVIIQDMGLLNLKLPNIEIHASTQCDIRTLDKVKFFENIGIKRVILARELTVEQIKEISKHSNIELECFIHGALCVSYSGQCYMSAFIGGRSANRGECAQACRKKYSLINEYGKYIVKDKYLLSLKDFCAKNYIKKLINSNVKSFKIEGRLKDETYVRNVVLYYRRLIDEIEECKKTSKGIIISDFEPDINKTFNRGYTEYFLGGKNSSKIFDFETPKARNELIGKVKAIHKDNIETDKNVKINPQDGLCYLTDEGLKGFLVNKVCGNKIYFNVFPIKLKAGVEIYRNQDVEFENKIKNSKIKRIIEVKVVIYKDKITACDDEFETSINYDFIEKAKMQDKMKESFIKCFKKSGQSIVSAKMVEFKTEFVPFLPVSELNLLRRNLYSKFESLRLGNYKKPEGSKIKFTAFKEKTDDYRLNINNEKAFDFYKKCGINPKEYSLETTGNFKGKELMRCKHCIRRALNICLKNTENTSDKLFLVDEKNKKYPLKFDCKKCEMAVIAP